MERFSLDDVQATAIVQMQLGRLTGLERIKIEEELAALREKISEYLEILGSHDRVLALIKEESLAIKEKFEKLAQAHPELRKLQIELKLEGDL